MKPKLIEQTETIAKQRFHSRMDRPVLGTREAADVSLSNSVTLNSLNTLLKGSILYLAASAKHENSSSCPGVTGGIELIH